MRINNLRTDYFSNQLQLSSKNIQRLLERLSTGKRVNSPRDSVADFSMIQGLDSQVRGLRQANLNINSGLGMLNTASSALSAQQDILQRMRELFVQASSSSLSASERSSIQDEVIGLREEFERIVNETEFNGQKLLNGGISNLTLQTGYDSQQTLDVSLDSVQSSDVFKKNVATGRFKTVESMAVGGSATEAAYGDFDNDGDIDYITYNSTDDTLETYLNLGDGQFVLSATQSDASTKSRMRLGDVNGDGILDVVGADGSLDTISVFYGNGDGSFDSRMTISSSDTANDLTLDDFDGDGHLDFAVVNSGGGGSYILDIFLNDGTGNFTLSSSTSGGAGVATSSIASGDIDGDGDADIVFSYGSTLFVYRGDGNGSFTEISSQAVGANIVDLKLLDLDGDGDKDVGGAVNLSALGSTDYLFSNINDGSGTFASATTYGVLGTNLNFQDVSFGDVNGDGILDAIGSVSNYLHIWIGDGDGTFSTATTYNSNSAAHAGVEDFDGDGILDIAVISSNTEMDFHYSISQMISAVSDLRATSAEDARAALEIVDTALDSITAYQNDIGTAINQLSIRSDSNLLLSESLSEARDSIELADIANDTSELVRNQILQQAQISVLAQANVQQQLVLSLLTGY